MNKLSKQIEKYQEQLKEMVIMDDYDGGEANQLRMVIDDLRKMETDFFNHKTNRSKRK